MRVLSKPSASCRSDTGGHFFYGVYMRVFISGAITGIEDYKEQFAKREKELKEMGYYPVNPVKIGERLKSQLRREPSYEEYLEEDLKILSDCDAINHLPNWEKSKGAIIEHKAAVKKGKTIVEIKILPRHW